MEERKVYLGMDVHKKTIALAAYVGNESTPRIQNIIANDKATIKEELARMSKLGKIICCYEAGFCGYELARYIISLGHNCSIAATSLIPKRSGDKVKTDKRDAKRLATLLRANLLTYVNIFSAENEEERALIRLRGQIRKDVVKSKHHILKFLDLRGYDYCGKSHWTLAHRSYLNSIKLEGTSKTIFSDYLNSLSYSEIRLKDADAEIEKLANTKKYIEKVSALKSFRGISTLTAMSLITEIESVLRFRTPHELMSYIGLTPSEHSSGDKIYRGSITRQGNKRLRYVLVETAWHYTRGSRVSPAHRKKLENQEKEIVVMSIKALNRLNKRFWHLAMKKDKNTAIVAVARELSGFIWAALRHVELKEAA